MCLKKLLSDEEVSDIYMHGMGWASAHSIALRSHPKRKQLSYPDLLFRRWEEDKNVPHMVIE